MTGLRLAVALTVAAAITLAEIGAVAWMNHRGSREHVEPQARQRQLPIIRPPAPQPRPEQATSPAAPGPNTRPQSTPPSPPAAPTALPSLSDRHPLASVSSSLPGLSAAGGPGGLSLTENLPTTKPARKATPTFMPSPRYPSDLRKRGVEGVVIVRIRLDAQGNVVSAVVAKSTPPGVFDDAAINAARRYRFRPAIKNGKASATTVEQRMVFRIKR